MTDAELEALVKMLGEMVELAGRIARLAIEVKS